MTLNHSRFLDLTRVLHVLNGATEACPNFNGSSCYIAVWKGHGDPPY